MIDMEVVVEKNNINNYLETDDEVRLILERQREAREGKVKSLEDSIRYFIEKRQAWKSIV